MAEPFGIAAGAIGIASTFTACVDCFEYIQFGRNFGHDFQTTQLTLDCAKLRLSRWGKAVDIYDDPELTKLDATPADLEKGKDILQQMLVLFAATGEISQNCRLKPKSSDDPLISSDAPMRPTARFTGLLSDIISLVDSIEKLLPATEVQAKLAREEAEIIGDRKNP